MPEERWVTIEEFPMYEISDQGRIYNSRTQRYMETSQTNHGHTKISLMDPNGERRTRSVPLMVAAAFVEVPNHMCDHLVVLNGDLLDVAASNLAWRPRWFAWKYTRQLKIPQPIHYHNLHVLNINTNVEYSSIVDAGMTEGLLFDNIWASTYRESEVFPYGHVFKITEEA